MLMRMLLAAGLVAPMFSVAHADDEQVAEGQKLYGEYCARCHGDGGEGTKKGPPVVGKAALPLDPPAKAKARKSQFHTAKDVFDFVSTKMPAKKPGSLTLAQYAAIMAFDLKANGVDVSKIKVDATTAAAIVLHP